MNLVAPGRARICLRRFDRPAVSGLAPRVLLSLCPLPLFPDHLFIRTSSEAWQAWSHTQSPNQHQDQAIRRRLHR